MPRSRRSRASASRRQGIKILTGAKVAKGREGRQLRHRNGRGREGRRRPSTAERMISAVGVVGNVENLGLEKLGVKVERGTIVIDGLGRTNVPGIYAIGDVAGPPMLAHKAEHEGVICVEAIKGLHAHPMDKDKIPGCTYCHPQVASRRPDRGQGEGAGLRDPRRPLSRSSATARRSRSASRTGSSRRSSTRRPASSSAPTWSAPRSPS